ncbi:aa3-type cytochrome c oxidase subunit IV [Parasedimentitalea marina]
MISVGAATNVFSAPLRRNDVVTGFFICDIQSEIYTNRIHPMADHQHGSMDTTVQENTYNGFITFVTRSCIASVAIAVFLAIFAT